MTILATALAALLVPVALAAVAVVVHDTIVRRRDWKQLQRDAARARYWRDRL